MSLRQALYRSTAPLVRAPRLAAARAISTSSPRCAGHGHDDHHHGASSGPDDTETHETWFSAPWRNTFILVALGYLAYPYLPERDTSPASAYLSSDNFHRLRSDPSIPYLTRLIARNMDTAKEVQAKTEKHIEDTVYIADTRVLLQDAQQPKTRPSRSQMPFDHASPLGAPVGSTSQTQSYTGR